MTDMFSTAQAEAEAEAPNPNRITEWDRSTCRELRDAMTLALQGVAEEYGIKIEAGSARYSSGQATFKVNCTVVSNSGETLTRELTDLRALFPYMEGHRFTHQGQQFTVIGFRRKARKNRWTIRRGSDGREFVASDWLVQLQLMQQERGGS